MRYHRRIIVLKTTAIVLWLLRPYEGVLSVGSSQHHHHDEDDNDDSSGDSNSNGDKKLLHVFKETPEKARSLLTPEVDYNEWTPLGRGDPLKNDPTFDYSPPTLDRVKYWVSPSFRTPDPPVAFFPTEEAPSISSTISDAKLLHKQNNNKQDIKRFFNVNVFKTEPPNVYFYNKYAGYHQRFQQQQPQYSVNTIHRVPPPVPAPPPRLLPSPMLIPPSSSTLYQQNNGYSVKNQNSTVNTVSKSSSSSSIEINRKRPQQFHNFSSANMNFVTLPTARPTTAISFPIDKVVFPDSIKDVSYNVDINDKSSSVAIKPLTTEKPSYLHILLGKEVSTSTNILTSVPSAAVTTATIANAISTVSPLSSAAIVDLSHLRYKPEKPSKNSLHLIIQGHSKVKKYGANDLEKSLGETKYRNDQINKLIDKRDWVDSRESRKFKIEDLLPFDEDIIGETFKDIVEEQAEGSGFGAALTKAIFPSALFNKTSSVAEHRKPKEF